MPPRVELRRSTRVPTRGAGAAVASSVRGGGTRGRGRTGRARGRARGARGAGRSAIAASVAPTVQDEDDQYEEVGNTPDFGAPPVRVQQADGDRQSKLFGSFLKKQPPRFRGDVPPEKAVEFLKDIVSICRPMGIEEELWVTFAISRFHEGPRDWWYHAKNSLRDRGEMPIGWARFEELFRENFCLRVDMADRAKELTRIEQGGRSVEAYEKRFGELCRLLPNVYPTEERRIEAFLDGLRVEIRTHMTLAHFQSFHEVRNAAFKIERDVAEAKRSGVKSVGFMYS